MADDDHDNSSTGDDAGAIDPQLLSLLVCPLTKQSLRFDREAGELISKAAGLAYPVRGGIAIMLPSEARSLDE
ncbi:MAG: Trm112 family protein [Ahrensia sp.]